MTETEKPPKHLRRKWGAPRRSSRVWLRSCPPVCGVWSVESIPEVVLSSPVLSTVTSVPSVTRSETVLASSIDRIPLNCIVGSRPLSDLWSRHHCGAVHESIEEETPSVCEQRWGELVRLLVWYDVTFRLLLAAGGMQLPGPTSLPPEARAGLLLPAGHLSDLSPAVSPPQLPPPQPPDDLLLPGQDVWVSSEGEHVSQGDPGRGSHVQRGNLLRPSGGAQVPGSLAGLPGGPADGVWVCAVQDEPPGQGWPFLEIF